jgi:hypothetical protein
MSIDLMNLVFHPNTFFAEITYEKKNLLFPFVFVALMGLFGIWLLWRFTFGYSLSIIVEMMALPFIVWVIVTLVIFCAARIFSGTGSLFATFQNIGFGTFPLTLAVAGSVRIVAVINGSPSTPVDYSLLPFLSWMVLPFWSFYLWYCGTLHAHHLSRMKAVVSVSIVIILLYGVWFINPFGGTM